MKEKLSINNRSWQIQLKPFTPKTEPPVPIPPGESNTFILWHGWLFDYRISNGFRSIPMSKHGRLFDFKYVRTVHTERQMTRVIKNRGYKLQLPTCGCGQLAFASFVSPVERNSSALVLEASVAVTCSSGSNVADYCEISRIDP